MPQLQYSPLRSHPLPMAAGAVIAPGDGICCNPSGFAVPASEATGLYAAGRAVHHGADNSSGTDGAVMVQAYRSGPEGFAYANSAGADEIALRNLGELCYFTGARSVGLTDGGGTRSAAGYIADVKGGVVFVEHPISIP